MNNISLSTEFKTILHRYKPIKISGYGSYGLVIQALDLTNNQLVAVKKINSIFENLGDAKRILREITLLRFMHNRFLVQLLGIEYDKDDENFDTIYLIFEYLPFDLEKIIKTNRYLTMKEIKSIIYQILCGVKYIHSCAVLHRDIKPGNILIDKENNIKICDFGLARSISSTYEDFKDIQTYEQKKITNEEKEYKKQNSHEHSNTTSPIKDNHIKKDNKNLEIKQKIINKSPLLGKRPPLLKNIKKNFYSVHVVTRWYRAPELILVEQNYSKKIDIWSVGCVFGELMMMMKENSPFCFERKPLFPGKYCYPLSPRKNKKNEDRYRKKDNDPDQLDKIFDVLGSPSEEDMEFITDPNAVLYIKSLQKREKMDLKKKFPGSDEDSLDLLSKMLMFNPLKRINVEDSLNHPFFKDIRNKKYEEEEKFEIELKFDSDNEITEEKLKRWYLEVIDAYTVK